MMDVRSDWRRYTARPLTIYAMKMLAPFVVQTLEGRMEGQAGDYLVEGTHEEFYPVRKDIFEHKYLPDDTRVIVIPEAGMKRSRRALEALKPEPEQVSTDSAPYCCYIDRTGHSCVEEAVWRLYEAGHPGDAYTDACYDHLTELATENTVKIERTPA